LFPRGVVEQVQFLELLASMEGAALVDMRDRWVWYLEGSGEFFVASVRRMIDERWLPEVSAKTRWINVVPIKVNVHAWKDLVCVVCLLLHDLIMNRGLLDAGGRSNNHRKKATMDTGTCSASSSDGILNDATPRVDAAMKVVSPSMVQETVAMECPVLNTPDVGPNPPPPTQEANASAGNAPGKPSYVTATGKPSGKKVKVRTLFTPGDNGIDVVVPVAYHVVANYIRYTWGKYGLVRSMFSSSTRLFSFQFSSINGLDAMLENGPWFIQNNLLILKKWHPNDNLLKEDVSTIPVWVKLHGVPVTAFSEDGLSAIATKLGTPLMLDSYTSDMCMQSWGMSSYARVMIELRPDVDLKDNMVMAMPKITRESHYTYNVRVEYEWKPPRCSSCKVFGHTHEECSKNTGAGEKKTVKNPSLTSRGVPVGPKIGFKPPKYP
nr:hypothetical protein [Tanacetum cinerariifolium]